MHHPRSSTFLIKFLAVFVLLAGATPAYASSATVVYGEPDASGVREYALIMQSKASVNAIEGIVHVEQGASATDINDAGSMVQFWITKPSQDTEKHTLNYAGIIPGGWSGEGVVMRWRSNAAPRAFVVDDTATHALLNDGAGTADALNIPASKPMPQQFALNKEPDTIPPKPFTPEQVTLPTDIGEQPMVVFEAHDNETGVAHYEIAYADRVVDLDSPLLHWVSVVSPTPLPEQAKGAFVYIKAVDMAGNSRIAIMPPTGAPRTNPIAIFIGIMSASIIGLFLLFRVWKAGKRKPH